MDSATEIDQSSTLAMPKLLANILSGMFKDTKFMDVALVGSQRSGEVLQPVRAHKAVLAVGSEFFSSLFGNHEFADSNKSNYTLDKVSHESLRLIVEVLYQGKVTDERIGSDVKFACDILEGSKYLLVDDLALACESILIKHHLSVTNCIFLWNIACKYPSLLKLTDEVEQFLAKSLSNVMLEESFLCMGSDKVCRMMRISVIETSTSPDDRFRAAFAWLEHDAGARRTFSNDILSTIPLTPGKISRQALIKASSSKALTEDATQKLLELLANSLKVAEFLVDPDFNAEASPATTSSNCFSGSQTDVGTLFCVCGSESGNETTVLKYHVSSKTWRRLKSLAWQQQFGAACVVRDRLMLFGGDRNGKTSSSVSEFETSSEDSTWLTSQALQLPYASVYCLAWGLRDTAYLCAEGADFFEYAAVANYFQTKPYMDVGRYRKSMTMSPTFDAVYVAGGHENPSNKPRREIEKFSLASDTWETIGLAAGNRVGLSSALCGEDLYLIAGDARKKTVAKFNVRTGKTYPAPALGSERQFCKAAMLNSNVICIFGDNHKSVEAYDVREGRWTVGVVVPDMPVAVYGCCLAWK